MSNAFNRTLSQLESMVRGVIDERSERKKREEQLALHNMATERQNARSDRFRALREKNQEIINRGFDINKDLRRGRDMRKLEAGEITPEQFNLKYGESVDMRPKPMPGQITDQDLLRSWTEYRKNGTLLDPMEFDEFKARYGQNNRTNLNTVGTNQSVENDIRNVTQEGDEYQSFSNRPVERTLESLPRKAPVQGPLMPNVINNLQQSNVVGVDDFATGVQEEFSKPLKMTKEIALKYLQMANGNQELAMQMAKADGYK